MPDTDSFPELLVAADPDVAEDTLDERLLDDEDTQEEDIRYEIASYGADYDVEGLVRRLTKGDVKIPSFQRGYVWPMKQASRFIESLVLGLPVPGVFLSTEPDTKLLMVIDGQQRLLSLQAFYDGVFPPTKREFALTDVQSSLVGKTYKTLPDDARRSLDNAIIHATVIKQTSPEDGGSAVYKIFERLNSGGILLSPQEIRTAIYTGRLTELLAKVNGHASWRSLFGSVNKRMRDQELILRFFALYKDGGSYKRPMKTFLNTFMREHRSPDDAELKEMARVFQTAADVANECIGARAFKPVKSFNAALFDALLVGIAKRLEDSAPIDPARLNEAVKTLLADEKFSEWISRSTADDEVVKGRITRATAEIAKA